jgi:beta-glucosidase
MSVKVFARLELAPGESKVATISLTRRDLAYWDPGPKQWMVTPGEYGVMVGSSSAKLELHGSLLIR